MDGKDPYSPPPYSAHPGQGQPPQGHYARQQQGYPPPQQGYPPPQQGYPPPQGYGYAQPPGHPSAGYSPQPYMPPVQQQHTNVVVVGGGAPAQTVIVNQRETVNHCLHCCISIFFPPWLFVWICLCICYGC